MKTFARSILGIIVIVIVALVIVFFIGWARVPDMLASTMSKKLKVSVHIDDVKLSLLSGIEIKQLEISNPKNYKALPKAFSAEKIRIKAPLKNYLQESVVIDQITIDGVYLGLIFDSATSTNGNWTTIMGNLKAETKKHEKEKKKVLIRSLVLTNISVDVAYVKDSGKVQHLAPIDRIEFTNVSSETGIPTDQIMNTVLGQMLKSVFQKENLKNMLKDVIENPSKYMKPFEGLFK